LNVVVSCAETISASVGLAEGARSLSQQDLLVLAAIAYYEPISRAEQRPGPAEIQVAGLELVH
jgi:hypothetical protein